MTHIREMNMEQGILLEAGTNELEILVFRLGATPFGINVAVLYKPKLTAP